MTTLTESSAVELLENALRSLSAAELALWKDTTPSTPMVRFRKYNWIDKEVIWPGVDATYRVRAHHVAIKGMSIGYGSFQAKILAQMLVNECKAQPRKILKVFYKIASTERWCLARAEGRKRAAQEILRQQDRAVRTLETLEALRVLGKIG